MEPDQFAHRAALLAACEHVGTKAALARAVGVQPQQVGNWLNRDKEIDPVYCARIETATGRRVLRQALRPHDWQTVWPELACDAQSQEAAHA